MRLAEGIVELLLDEGVDLVFGNPGTTELPFVDALCSDDRLRYVLGVHEGPLVSMADGYGRATGRTPFVNLHVAAGTANGLIGMLNAKRSRVPMVVMAGQQDSRHLIQDPMLSGDLVAIAAAGAKWSVEARRAEDVPVLLRRAFREAAQPPEGPVFISVPMDLFEVELPTRIPVRSSLVETAPSFDPGPISEQLARASRLAIVAGDGVGRSGAVSALVRVAECLAADVYHAPMHDRLNFPMNHPAYRGMLLPENEKIRRVLDGYDAVLFAGVRAFEPHHFSPQQAVDPDTVVIQIDEDPGVIGRNYPATWGLVGPIGPILDVIAERLGTPLGGAVVPDESPALPAGTAPFDAEDAARSFAAALPIGSLLVEEAITTGLLVRRHLRLAEPGSFQHTIGGGLGWGIGAAVGLALGRPDRPVFAALGDGCATFGVQGLWSAAHEKVSATFVVFNNAEYRTLKQTLTGMRAGEQRGFLGMDLSTPRLHWSQIAEGFGVASRSVTSLDELGSVISGRRAGDEPLLIEVPVRGLADQR